MANRLKKVLPYLISINQYAYVENRNIADALRTISDVLDYTKLVNLPGILLCIDFEKAFDSISWSFLFKVLESFNFGESFKTWIKLFYTNISSCIMNNGHSTGYFEIKRGVRQGDPLSAYLFILVTELLTRVINGNKDIHGIRIGKKEIKLVQYADDTTMFLKDGKSVQNLLKILHAFEMCSGLKINIEKTEAMWIGANSSSEQKPYNLQWNETIKILGIYFGYDKTETIKSNFNQQLEKLQKTLNLWKMRDLSLIGRILITKQLGLSKFIYVTKIVDTPEDICREIDKIIYEYIWKGKKAMIKKSTLIGEYKHGGLKAPHIWSIIKAQQALWIKKYIDSNEAQWKNVLDTYLKPCGKTFLCYCNYAVEKLPKTMPKFYLNCLRQWQEIIQLIEYRTTLSQQMVWNNKEICVNGNPVYYDYFREAGLWTIKDLYK